MPGRVRAGTVVANPLPSGLLPSAQGLHLVGAPLAAGRSRAFTAGRDLHPTPRAFSCQYPLSVPLDRRNCNVFYFRRRGDEAELVRSAAREEVERVAGDRKQDLEAFDRARCRPGKVAYQRLSARARDGARQHAEAPVVAVTGAPDRLGDARRLPFEDAARALGGEIAWPEA